MLQKITKIFSFLIVLLLNHSLVAQSLPLDFESIIINYDPIGFGSASMGPIPTSIIANPNVDADNGSATVWNIIKPQGAQSWAGASIFLVTAIDFSSSNIIKLRFWSDFAGVPVLLKIEDVDSPPDANGNPSVFAEVQVNSTINGGWENMTFDMSTFGAFDAAIEYEKIVVFPDFGNTPFIGDIPFYFDDIEVDFVVVNSPVLPIDFESSIIDYNPVGFGDASMEPIPTAIIANPDASGNNTSETVWHISKTEGSQVWAGASMNLAVPIDFSEGSSISINIWSPFVNSQILFKIEDVDSPPDANGNPSVFAEVAVNTTTSNAWETLIFDMSSFGTFDAAIEYERIAVFPDFGLSPIGGDIDYYFDDIQNDLTNGFADILNDTEIKTFPNPTKELLHISYSIPASGKIAFDIVDVLGRTVQSVQVESIDKETQNQTINVNQLASGIYYLVARLNGKTIAHNKIIIKK